MRLELKICERCGCIWLRPLNRVWVYCARCYPTMRDMARSGARRPFARCVPKAGAQ